MPQGYSREKECGLETQGQAWHAEEAEPTGADLAVSLATSLTTVSAETGASAKEGGGTERGWEQVGTRGRGLTDHREGLELILSVV